MISNIFLSLTFLNHIIFHYNIFKMNKNNYLNDKIQKLYLNKTKLYLLIK